MSTPCLKMSLPSRGLENPRFKYVNADKTDVRRTWRKFRLLQRIQRRDALLDGCDLCSWPEMAAKGGAV